MAIAGTAVTWTTVRIGEASFGAKLGHPNIAGPLAVPAPQVAGSLPQRIGPVHDASERQIIAEFRQRFAAAELTASVSDVTVLSPAGLYGEPGHIDPATGRTAWVMYLGLSASRSLGAPALTVGRLMTSLLGRGSMVGPWRVRAGPRGGLANCTVAVLDQTQVSVCGWATGRTAGAVISPARDTSAAELATLMVTMRYNLEPRSGGPRLSAGQQGSG